MWQMAHLFLSTLMLWALVTTSCANKKDPTTPMSSDLINTQIEKQEDIEPSTTHTQKDTTAPEKAKLIEVQYDFKYDLSSPSNTSILDSELVEISALSYDQESKILYAINDELGILFSLDPTNGQVLEKLKFGKKGDYEGVEIGKEGVIYAVESNGNITAIQKSDGKSRKIRTALRSSNDVEGLGYDPNKKLLLLACKGSPSLSKHNEKSKGFKSVFGWSIETEALVEKPLFTIKDEDLISYFESLKLEVSKAKAKKFKKRLKSFSPSGIAYNEKEDLYYLISAVGELLITINSSSQIKHIEFLDDVYFAQPEGICFGKDNALYISTEGKGLLAKLMKFNIK